jgi:PAS domain S-box-containing protein
MPTAWLGSEATPHWCGHFLQLSVLPVGASVAGMIAGIKVQMSSTQTRQSWIMPAGDSKVNTGILALLILTLCYLSARLAGAFVISVPQTVWPLWPGCALLVAILLLAPRKIWPILLPAGLTGFLLSDLQAGVSIRDIAWLILADTIEILVASWGVSYFLEGLPRLNNLKALAKYSFITVFLSSLVVATIGINGLSGDDWINWRFSVLSEALAFLTVTPAILGLFGLGRARLRASPSYYLEAFILVATLASLSYRLFLAPGRTDPPALLYSLVPCLIWSALRFGSTGVGCAATIVAMMSIWGAVHGRGPFLEADPINRVLSLQLFLLCSSIPFMVLAVLVEDRKIAQDNLSDSEERLRLSMESGKAVGWEWDLKTGKDTWFGDLKTMFGIPAERFVGRPEDFHRYVHPDDRQQVSEAVAEARESHLPYEEEFRVVWPNGNVRWVAARGKFYYSASGVPERMLGMAHDVTERKLVEQALRESEADLTEAQRLANVGSWQWDVQTDTVTWSEQLYRIAGVDPSSTAVSYQGHETLYTPESWMRLRAAVEEALRSGTPYELDLEMYQSDGTTKWIIAKGDVRRDGAGNIVKIRGTVDDITVRKRAQEELRKSEERLRLAIQGGKMFTCDWDAATDIFTHSPESAQILRGDNATSSTGKQILESVHPEDREAFIAAVAGISPEKPGIKLSYRMVRSDGSIIWLEKNSRAQFDQQGRLLRIIGIVADITERKRSEEALRASEERLRLAVQAGKMFAYEWDAATDLLVRSAESTKILGIAEATPLTGQEVLAKVYPEDRERLLTAITSLSPEKPSLEITYRMVRPDGTIVWLERNSIAQFDEQGQLLRVIGIIADITERKRAEDAVRQSEEKYRRIVETTNEGIWLLDQDFHTSFVNRQMAEMLGYQQVEMLGRSVFDFYFPEDIARKQQGLARRRELQSERMDDRLRRRDGSELWVRMAAIPISKDNGDFDGAMAVVSDISSQRLAEEALRESEARFRLVASTAPMLIWMSGPDRLCTYFNNSWLTFTGRSMELELGNGWAEGVHPEDLQKCLDTYVRAFDAREQFQMEYRLRRHDGEYRWLLDIGVPRFNQDGSFAGYIGSCVDVSDRKLAEEALSGVNRRLIEAQERERARIARELHDDIGQRLALLTIELEQFRQKFSDLPPEPMHHIGLLRNHSSDIATDVQSLSHELHSSKIEYLGIATALRAFCHEFSGQQNVEIVFTHGDIPRALPQEISLCLFRVSQEALQNALKHSGVRRFDVELNNSSNEIQLVVRDAGSGFNRDEALKTHGLGLISMAERLKLVGGRLSIESQPHCGTTVFASVPLSKAASASA